MSIRSASVAGAALIAALAGTPALASNVYYDFTVPGLGSGRLAYDDAVLQGVDDGLFVSPLTAFAFVFAGTTYGLADAADPLAWFAETGPAFVGIQYIGTRGGDGIEFAPGFGFGDLGSFAATLGTASAIGPIALVAADFVLDTAGVPAPSALACVLAGFGIGTARRRTKPR